MSNLSDYELAHIRMMRSIARLQRKTFNRARFHRQYRRRMTEKWVKVSDIVTVHVGPLTPTDSVWQDAQATVYFLKPREIATIHDASEFLRS